MLCPLCGAPLAEGAAFCGKCGASLASSPVSPVAAPSVPDKKAARWPVAAWLLVLLGLLGYVLGLLISFFTCRSVYGMPAEIALANTLSPFYILTLILTAASAVLFLIPTKKLAFLSAIPRLLLSFSYPVLFLLDFFMWKRSLTLNTLFSFVLDALLPAVAILYFLVALIRPKGPALPAIHLAASILYGLAVLAALAAALARALLMTGEVIWMLSDSVLRLSELLPLAGFAAAAFSLRRRESHEINKL